MLKKQPFCWKCTSAITTLTKGNSFVLDGCTEYGCTECSDIKNYADAEKLCPLFDHSPKKVILTVIDGEVSLVEKPDNILVEVRDYVDTDDVADAYEQDEQGDTYRVFSFPATKIKFSANGKQCFTDVEIDLIEQDEPMLYINYYRCPDCSNEWDNERSCQCDDECGECGCSDISPYKSDDIEQEDKNEALKNITVLQHDVSYFLGENELLTIEVGDTEYEHILYMIQEGYIEGELNKTDPKDDEKTIIGWWKIVK